MKPNQFVIRQRLLGTLCAGLFATGLLATGTVAGPLKIDLGMDTGRSDTATKGWQEWQIGSGPEMSRKFGHVEVTLRSTGELQGQWFKRGLASGATMATDGVIVTGDSPKLQLMISGLSPGRHSLVTYHNTFSSDEPSPPLQVTVANSDASVQAKPTARVATNGEAESAYVEFETTASQPGVTVELAIAEGQTGELVLNGLEIDGSNPKTKAQLPSPAQGDWHVDGDAGKVLLEWQPSAGAEKFEVYLASSRVAAEAEQLIEAADKSSSAHHTTSETPQCEFSVDPAQSLLHYCWRVDSVDAAGKITRGDVWKFRVRQLAFPGAEGYGRFAIGGRGGRVVHVTNLDDSGPGSLRAALELDEPRTVVFDVSGRIDVQSRLVVRNPYLTLACQTAPGKGICISNYNLGVFGNHDCIIRFVRVRPGDTAGQTLDGMGLASSDHCIVDHCSISWTQDESFSSRGAKNITLQRTLISEALNVAGHKKYEKGKEHGYAASIGGDVGSFHHNLLAHCSGRNWSLAGGVDPAGVHAGRLDIRNNLVYNWRTRTTDGGAMEVNFVGNYYRPGPATRVFHVLMPQHEMPFGPQEYYVEGNIMEGRYGPEDPLAGVKQWRDKPISEFVVDQPFFESHVTTTPAEDVVADVLADVGCTRPVLDEHDQRVIEEVRTRQTTYKGSVTGYPGLPDSQEDVGGWEEYPEMHRPADWDTDGDGLPNWWEARHNLNPQSEAGDLADAHGDLDFDGYTNIEEYLHWLAVPGNEVPQ